MLAIKRQDRPSAQETLERTKSIAIEVQKTDSLDSQRFSPLKVMADMSNSMG